MINIFKGDPITRCKSLQTPKANNFVNFDVPFNIPGHTMHTLNYFTQYVADYDGCCYFQNHEIFDYQRTSNTLLCDNFPYKRFVFEDFD